MGFFDFLKTSNRNEGRYISESDYIKNRARQLKMTPQTMEQLRKIQVLEDHQLKLEFFFYTNELHKARGLEEELRLLSYSVSHNKSPGDENIFVIKGWLTKMKMSESVVLDWTSQMCEFGFKHDSEFDGWGTTLDQ